MVQERKTRANGRASREAILAAALAVFAEKGHRGTTLTDIATRIGMTQPGLLHHFATKDHLLLEVVAVQEAQTQEEFARLSDPDQLPIRDAIRALARINKDAPVQQQLLTTLSAEAVPADHPLHEHFVDRYRTLRARFASLLDAHAAAGHIRDDIDTEAYAREVIATLDGLHLQWLLDPGKVDLVEALGTYADRLVEQLEPRRVVASKRR